MLDKTPLRSKKFIAYITASMCLKAYMFFATWRGEGDTVIMLSIFMTVFLDVAYVMGLVALESLTHYVQVIFSAKKEVIDTIKKAGE